MNNPLISNFDHFLLFFLMCRNPLTHSKSIICNVFFFFCSSTSTAYIMIKTGLNRKFNKTKFSKRIDFLSERRQNTICIDSKSYTQYIFHVKQNCTYSSCNHSYHSHKCRSTFILGGK